MKPLSLVLVAMLIGVSAAQAATPTQFRVLATIHTVGQNQPIAEHLTLFDAGIAYHLPQHERRFVTVYDPREQLMVLLDRVSQVQTRVKRDDLIRITAQLRAAIKNPQDQQKWGMQAQATTTPDGRYQIQFGNVQYSATTQTANQPGVAAEFGQFVDLSARLNLLRRLGPPPFGRMTLNQSIAANQLIPLELTRTMARDGRAEELRKYHQLSETLTADDLEQIKQIRSMMTLYRHVPFADFPK